MDIEFDDAKDAVNIAKHRLSLAAAVAMTDILDVADRRTEYGEQRFVAYGLIEGRLFACVWTPRGDVRRIISLRKANRREIRAYHSRIQEGS